MTIFPGNKYKSLIVLFVFGAVPARAVMNGRGQDIFPQTAIFQSSATITYTNAANAGLTVSSGVVVSTGSVGIGTAAPVSRLEVRDGDIRISTTTGSRGIIFQDGTAQTSAAQAAAVPAGFIGPYAGGSAPGGWLLCDGSAVSRTTYAALFGAIGTTYGPGDGSTTFNLPDIRGRVPLGAGQGSGLTNRILTATGGEEAHQLSTAEIPSHSHYLFTPGNSIAGTVYTYWGTNEGTAPNPDTYTGSTGGGGAHNNMQPFLVLNYIIKY